MSGAAPVPETRIAVGDLTFDARIDGPEGGTGVLLLHGFPQTSLAWSATTGAARWPGRWRAATPTGC